MQVNSPPTLRQAIEQVKDDPGLAYQACLISGVGERIPMRNSLTIGEGQDCDVCISSSLSSRTWARIRFAQNAWFIQKEQNSEHDVYVNDRAISATRLSHGDRIAIANKIFTCEIL